MDRRCRHPSGETPASRKREPQTARCNPFQLGMAAPGRARPLGQSSQKNPWRRGRSLSQRGSGCARCRRRLGPWGDRQRRTGCGVRSAAGALGADGRHPAGAPARRVGRREGGGPARPRRRSPAAPQRDAFLSSPRRTLGSPPKVPEPVKGRRPARHAGPGGRRKHARRPLGLHPAARQSRCPP